MVYPERMSTNRICSCISAATAIFSVLFFPSLTNSLVQEFSQEEQNAALVKAFTECLSLMGSGTTESDSSKSTGSHTCAVNFDRVACWPAVAANQTAYISCPDYLHLFDSEETASRHCTADGTWLVGANNYSGGDYYDCYKNAEKIQQSKQEMYDMSPKKFVNINSDVVRHLSYIQNIYTVGNAISLTALLAAITLFATLRKLLACSRNVIHLNLFISFLLRGVCTLVHFFVTSKRDSSIQQSYQYNEEADDFDVIAEGSWQCRLSTTIWMFTRLSNFAWIFMEAFYLHLLLFVLTFSDKRHTYKFIAFGWGTPLLFLVPWVVVRITTDNHRCWVTYSYKAENLRWIVDAPVILIVLANFGFFINFIKLLSSKLRAAQVNGYKEKVNRRLAKSSFILIPLFGVHYIIFLFTDLYPNISENATLELVGLYFDTIFTSFQGAAVAALFCFCNSEVISELQRKWVRFKANSGISGILFNNTRIRRSSPSQRISLSSDTGVTYAPRRHSSNGLLSISLPSDRRSSLRREVSIPTPIDEEHCRLMGENRIFDGNHNVFELENR